MIQRDLPVAIDERHFEDYPPGAVVQYGPIAVDAAAVVDFGRRFDPQPFHVDAEAAARGPFGGLIASGWHTAALLMRLLVDHYLPRRAGLASPGIDALRWLAPVRPGDELTLRVTVLEARRSQSKPDRGLLRSRIEGINQRGETVITMDAMTLLKCRAAAPEGAQ